MRHDMQVTITAMRRIDQSVADALAGMINHVLTTDITIESGGSMKTTKKRRLVGYYKDLLTGKNVAMYMVGDLLSKEERFHKDGGYRLSHILGESCSSCRHRVGVKCRMLGIDKKCDANNIALDRVCNFWKTTVRKKTVKRIKRQKIAPIII